MGSLHWQRSEKNVGFFYADDHFLQFSFLNFKKLNNAAKALGGTKAFGKTGFLDF